MSRMQTAPEYWLEQVSCHERGVTFWTAGVKDLPKAMVHASVYSMAYNYHSAVDSWRASCLKFTQAVKDSESPWAWKAYRQSAGPPKRVRGRKDVFAGGTPCVLAGAGQVLWTRRTVLCFGAVSAAGRPV